MRRSFVVGSWLCLYFHALRRGMKLLCPFPYHIELCSFFLILDIVNKFIGQMVDWLKNPIL